MTKEEILTRAVLDSTHGSNLGYCALQRLATPQTKALDRHAADYGFSEAEARGIMDGWDETAGVCGAFKDESWKPRYADGYALGMKLCLMARDL